MFPRGPTVILHRMPWRYVSGCFTCGHFHVAQTVWHSNTSRVARLAVGLGQLSTPVERNEDRRVLQPALASGQSANSTMLYHVQVKLGSAACFMEKSVVPVVWFPATLSGSGTLCSSLPILPPAPLDSERSLRDHVRSCDCPLLVVLFISVPSRKRVCGKPWRRLATCSSRGSRLWESFGTTTFMMAGLDREERSGRKLPKSGTERPVEHVS